MDFLNLIQILIFLPPKDKKYLIEFDSSDLIWYKFIRSLREKERAKILTVKRRSSK